MRNTFAFTCLLVLSACGTAERVAPTENQDVAQDEPQAAANSTVISRAQIQVELEGDVCLTKVGDSHELTLVVTNNSAATGRFNVTINGVTSQTYAIAAYTSVSIVETVILENIYTIHIVSSGMPRILRWLDSTVIQVAVSDHC